MRPLAIFVVGVLLVFGALAAVIMLSRESERVFVVVDSSFPMREVWAQLPGTLDDIASRGGTEFALATEKELIHDWQDELRFREVSQFAPCDFSGIDAYAEASDAAEQILVTTPASCATDTLAHWTVIQLRP